MKTKRVPVLQSQSVERGFFGFYHNFTSLKGIYEDLVKNGPLKEFFPFQFCQDHLENFFSLVRYQLYLLTFNHIQYPSVPLDPKT